jgi:pSer/pThr/pTyr-binding forkhead associated (FHA) protein
MARLELLTGKSAGTVFELEAEDGAWEIGTSRRAQLRIRDRGISYTHATITNEGGVFQLIDEQSLAGTFVNGEQLEQLEPHVLSSGDSVRFGSTEAVFTCDPPAPERSPSGRIDALRSGAEELGKAELERELIAAQAELQVTLKAAEQVREELSETEEELSRAIEEGDALRRRVEELEAGGSGGAEDGSAARAELEAELADAISEAQAKEAERVTLAAELDATQRALEELKNAEPPPADEQVEQARAAQAQAEARVAQLEGQVERLRLNLEEALNTPPEPDEVADLAAEELETARARIDELEGELDELRAETQNLHVELEARNTRIQELAEARQDLVEETKSWGSDKQRPDGETRPIDPSLIDKLRGSEAAEAAAEAEDLRQQVEEINSEMLELQDELERLERENNELKERLAEG